MSICGLFIPRIGIYFNVTGMQSRFEKGQLNARPRGSWEWVRLRNQNPEGLVFLTPLIGGSRSHLIRHFRFLTKFQFDLFSFSYSGHGHSSNRFCPSRSISDTVIMLRKARSACRREGLPFYGIAMSYAAIPVLYGANLLQEPFDRLVLINAIPRLGWIELLRSFSTYCREISPPGHMKELMELPRAYLDFLFPHVRKGKRFFGNLERKRTQVFKTIAEFLAFNPLRGIQISETPVLCLYAGDDRLLRMYDNPVGPAYEKMIRQLCPRAVFGRLAGGHFLSCNMSRRQAIDWIGDYFG